MVVDDEEFLLKLKEVRVECWEVTIIKYPLGVLTDRIRFNRCPG